jgi:hypothetical protein
MGMYEFFFPEQAEANHLRSIASSMRTSARRSGKAGKRVSELEHRVGELEDDLDFLSLITLTLFGILNEKGLVDRRSLMDRINQVDMFDGRKDGKVSPEALRKAFGFAT